MTTTHRKHPQSNNYQVRLVCGVPAITATSKAFLFEKMTDRWRNVTCPECLAQRPVVGDRAEKGVRRVHFGVSFEPSFGGESITVDGAAFPPRTHSLHTGAACGAVVHPSECSADPADVNCGACHRSRALREAVKGGK